MIIDVNMGDCIRMQNVDPTDINEELPNGIKSIVLSQEDNQRIYTPWKYSLIIKLMGLRITHQYLRTKLQQLWKIMDQVPLIDLRTDYYILKFRNVEQINLVLNKGPWFINGRYLFIQKWVPNFIPKKDILSTSAIWIRLPQLPTEYYDSLLLHQVGNSIGQLLKIDACTSSTLRGRYARLCVQIAFANPVPNWIKIGNHLQRSSMKPRAFSVNGVGGWATQ